MRIAVTDRPMNTQFNLTIFLDSTHRGSGAEVPQSPSGVLGRPSEANGLFIIKIAFIM